jgi:ankyrin repeat protein
MFNEVYEANLRRNEKPDASSINDSSSTEHRTNFIKQKYIHKSFVQKTVRSEQESTQALESAIQESDMHAILQAYAEGAKPEARRDQIGLSCLHLAVEYGQLHIVEFLLQNANDSPDGPVDSRGNTLLHHALESYCGKDLCKLILRKYPIDAKKSNYLGKFPAECTK